jgi:hypothetical protein
MNAVVKSQPRSIQLLFAGLLKMLAMLMIILTITPDARAQHCDGCSVNLNGPEVVQVGQTVTYTVMPLWPNGQYISWYWDGFYNLSSYGTIVDQGIYPSGEHWATIYFHSPGYTWVTWEAYFSPYGVNYDELPITINP